MGTPGIVALAKPEIDDLNGKVVPVRCPNWQPFSIKDGAVRQLHGKHVMTGLVPGSTGKSETNLPVSRRQRDKDVRTYRVNHYLSSWGKQETSST